MINADYCCRQTLEKGTSIINTILAKEVLCGHDVKKINKIYNNNKELQVLENIIKKIVRLADEKNLFSLISLYHLQRFVGRDSNLEKHFSQMWSQIEKNPQMAKEMAVYLSCCHSGQKREKPQNYPLYLQTLLKGGYIHLYDHLMMMRTFTNRMTRQDEIRKISFSLLSHIILETREAIIQKVKNSIPYYSPNILFLIGGTGAGKSTTLCFLRGDEMTHENFCYQSKTDLGGMIGDQIASSCTFLPTVEKVKDWIIVDFPGFEDTNGPLVSMGIEFALKALIKEYHPKVLVIESITNTEAAKDLGNRLERLLKNREDCLLGITKYAKDPDFIEIKNLETKQRREQNLEINQVQQEIDELKGALEYALEDGFSEEDIQKMEQELAQLLQKEEEIQLVEPQLLPDTPLKIERRQKIQEKETVLSEQIGIPNIFRFDNLQDLKLMVSCFQTLSEKKLIHASSENIISPNDVKFILDCIGKNLINIDFELNSENFDTFKLSVLESSFISTIFSKTQPEIGRLLHLPEMDQSIAHKFDKQIISQYIENIIKVFVLTFEPSSLKSLLKEMKGQISQDNYNKFKKKIRELKDYIIILLKGELPTSTALYNSQWVDIYHKYRKDTLFSVRVGTPSMLNISNLLPILLLPLPIVLLVIPAMWYADGVKNQQEREKFSLEYIDPFIKDLDNLYNFFLNLKELEKNILKKYEIKEAFSSFEIENDSIIQIGASIKSRINKVRKIYGEEDWDRRIETLKEKFKIDYPSWLFGFLPLCAYLLIEPGTSGHLEITNSNLKITAHSKSGKSSKEYVFEKNYISKLYSSNKFQFPEQFIKLFDEPLLLNRVLNAAAFLKANEV